MIIATNNGVHPCHKRSRTCPFRLVESPNAAAERTTMRQTIAGTGVCMKGNNAVAMNPRTIRVTKSPRQEATGGAMLSVVD